MEGAILLLILGMILFFPITFAAYTYEIAKSKGRASTAWVIGGLFLGPIAMLAVGLMEPKSVSDRENKITDELAEEERRKEWEAQREEHERIRRHNEEADLG